MTGHTATPDVGPPAVKALRRAAREATGYWWVGIVAGIAWLVAALVILQFDGASIATVGILVGILFMGAAAENAWLATLDVPMRWVWAVFGALFFVAGIVSFAQPVATFAGMADMLGFLFLMIGLWWMVRAFLERPINPLWWLGLISGMLMTTMAFWTSGQFFIERAYVLLVFAGIWALMQGVTNIARGFELRALHKAV